MDRDYEILGLAPGASPEEVKEAYRDLVKVWHPDRFSSDPHLQQKAQAKLKEINAAYARLCSVQGDLGTGQSSRSKPESPPPEQSPHTPPRPPSQGKASQASREETKARKARAENWWKVRAWQLGSFLGDLSVGGWWLSGGRFSLWKMYKLVGVMLLCVIVGAVVFQMLGETIGGIIFLLVAMGIGALAVIWFVRSWVEYLRDIANKKGSKEDS